LGGSVHTVEEKAEALILVSKEIGLEVNADKTKYVVMSRDHNAERSHNMKIDDSSFERVEEFKYLGTTLTIKILLRKNLMKIEVRKCLLFFGSEFIVFQFAIQKFID